MGLEGVTQFGSCDAHAEAPDADGAWGIFDLEPIHRVPNQALILIPRVSLLRKRRIMFLSPPSIAVFGWCS
jgi:hypothetical protein